MAGKGRLEDFFILIDVPCGFSMYCVMHLIVCQITNPKQIPLMQEHINVLKNFLKLFGLQKVFFLRALCLSSFADETG